MLMATVWHAKSSAAANAFPLGLSGNSSVVQGQSFLPSASPPFRHLSTFATPPLSHSQSTLPFGEKTVLGKASSSSHVGHSFMGLVRKVCVYDSSGAQVMACDCEQGWLCADGDEWRVTYVAGVGEAVMNAPCEACVVVDPGVFVENIVVSRSISIYR